MNPVPRFEEKFVLDPFQYRAVTTGIAGFMKKDKFSTAASQGRYFVGSLYFDTSDYRAYMEKITGERNRIKFRIRSYTPVYDDAEFVSVELKTRSGRLIIKYGTHAPISAYDRYMKTGSWGPTDDPVLIEFERIARLQCQKPKVVVAYEREAFASLRPNGPRISFDHAVRYARATSLFPKNPIYRFEQGYPIILEIKTPDDGPDWLQKLVRDLSLKAVPHSKYANGVEQTQVDMWVPR
jgi:SPX domain protein involved in polyphosphate accumulation